MIRPIALPPRRIATSARFRARSGFDGRHFRLAIPAAFNGEAGQAGTQCLKVLADCGFGRVRALGRMPEWRRKSIRLLFAGSLNDMMALQAQLKVLNLE
jgi:hypothetical protein